jgi:hypothetical protein
MVPEDFSLTFVTRRTVRQMPREILSADRQLRSRSD